MTQRQDILAVIGGQYGSEGKGNIVAHIAKDYGVHVRVGGPNAGHSFKHEGREWKMQSIPCGWINLGATLIIGRNALIAIDQLAKEWREIRKIDDRITERMFIDRHAGIISPWHHTEAGGTGGEAHKRYGSTGEGVGVARLARIARFPGDGQRGFYRAGDLPLEFVPEDFRSAWREMLCPNTPEMIQDLNIDWPVLLEGTQGFGLSLIHGPWPYVTNHDTNAAQLAADCGLPPRIVNRCLLVVRTLPIRVAGNSGPLQREIDWQEVSRRVGHEVEERTTVTKKIRRIGEWDESLVEQACLVNGPTSLAVNFIDYLSPEDEGINDATMISDKGWSFINYVDRLCGVPVLLAGTGGDDWSVARLQPPARTGNYEWRL